MKSHRLAVAELLRLTSAPMLRLALVALIVIPSLYAGLYLYANRDPYAGMRNVPAAVVTEDRGTTLSSGERVQVGDDIAKTLLDSDSFAWSRVDREEAVRGVREGRYDFAIVVPAGFSADLASVASTTPRQATLEQITNDANGYLTRTISNEVIAQVTKSISQRLSSTAASKVMESLDRIRTNLTQASDGASQLAGGADELLAGQKKLADGAATLADGAGTADAGARELAAGAAKLDSGLAQLDEGTAALPTQTAALADGARQVAAGNAKIAKVGEEITSAAGRLRGARTAVQADVLAQLDAIDAANAAAERPDPRVSAATKAARDKLAKADADLGAVDTQISAAGGKLGELSSGSNAVADGAAKLASASTTLRQGIVAAHGGASQLAGGASRLSGGLGELAGGAAQLRDGEAQAVAGTGKLADGAHQLSDGLASGLSQLPAISPEQRRASAEVLGAPVQISRQTGAEAENYGAGLAPFFLALSLWIGAYVLFLLVRPLSLRAIAANQPGWRVALSGWMTPALIAVVQALVAYLLVGQVLGFRFEHPLLTPLFMAGVSCVYAAILLALAARLGAVGKFLGLVLMVVQLVSAGGTFPWQTLPVPLQVVHHLAPMSYVVEGLRHLMYGGSLHRMPLIAAVLAAYFVLALVATRWAALRLRIWTPERIAPALEI